ncbi:MAG: thioredoxin [Parcubacteria group bacterium]|jgi:thioredoxin 1
MAIELTDDNFKKEVAESDKVVLVDFWAPWCGPCQMMGPIIDELSKEVGDRFKIGKINIDENPVSASEYGIMSIPAIKVFKSGKVVKEFVGVQNKNILKTELESI